jgi:dGTPase
MKRFKNCLKDKAFLTENSRGRRNPQSDEDKPYFNCIDPFRLDMDKILNSKARRRQEDKTQVICDPENPHVCTRSRHTDEVVSAAVKIAEISGLNVSLCEAIAMVHDIGHTPYGHVGEEFLSEITGKKFRHEIFGIVIAQHIERKGEGLNLSFEVLEGILNHSRGKNSLDIQPGLPLEYNVVMIADKLSYIFSDINDAIRYDYLMEKKVPAELSFFGKNQRERMLSCIFYLLLESCETGTISFSQLEAAKKFEFLRQWMYENYYSCINWDIQKVILEKTYDFLSKDTFFHDCKPAVLLALLTDKELNRLAGKTFLCGKTPKARDIKNSGIAEIIPYIRGKEINFDEPDLDWGKNQ